jgi:4'-phosphopantetheinyl transferase
VIAIARLYTVPLIAIPTEMSEEGLRYISEEKRARLHRFRQREDLVRGLWADLILRSIITEELHLSNEQIQFEQNAYGKPHLSGVNNFHFNVSHAGEWVACLVDSEPVGVDVEHVQTFDEAIARSFFAAEEHRFIMEATDEQEKQLRFYQIWTAKESYIKAVGKGLSLPLNAFSVMTAEGVEGDKQLAGEAWRLKSLHLEAFANLSSQALSTPYLLTTCCKPGAKLNGLEQLTPNQILTKIRSVVR